MSRKKIDKTRVLTVFALTSAIFLIGVIIGNVITKKKFDMIEVLQQDLRTDTSAIELQYLLVAEDPCNIVNASPFTNQLYQINSRLSFMENRLGENNEDVLRLKEYYSMLQIRHYLFSKKIVKECDRNLYLILYFYSNQGDCPKCEQQGFILTYIRKKYENVRVYAFDINMENPAIETLKGMYGIRDAPSVVINDQPFVGFMSRDMIEGKLHSE